MISPERFDQYTVSLPEMPITPSLVNELKDRYDLSSNAIESLSLYVELAQTAEVRRALEITGGSNGADLSDEVLQRASKSTWCKGHAEVTGHWRRRGRQADEMSVIGWYTASLFLAYGKIVNATGSAQPVVIPPKFRQDFPDIFGHDPVVILDEKLF